MPASLPDPAADRAACRALMRTGSRSFFAAAHVLPRKVRDPATALYAFCRLADDAIDGGGGHAALARLRARLDAACNGTPGDDPADRALADAILRFQIPHALPHALLEGFAWDLDERRYETLDDLLDYAARVAGSVGAMMAVLMGARSPQVLARACELGVAMQLTNIARDVGEDARAGRLYLPLALLDAAGVDPAAFLAAPKASAALAGVVAQVLEAAAGLYRTSSSGIAALPRSCRPGIRAAGLVYADIGRDIARNGYDTISRRAHVSTRRKAALLTRSVVPRPVRRLSAAPALPGCQFLVDAAARESKAVAPELAPLQALRARLDWTFDLFERLHLQQLETR